MRGQPWNVLRAAEYGVAFGILYSVTRTYFSHPGAPPEYYIGGILGGAIAGALLFGVVAFIRNRVGGYNRRA